MPPLIAGPLIDEARDAHVSFDPVSVPDGMLLRRLSRVQRDLYRDATAANETALAVRADIATAAVLASITTGQALALPASFQTLNSLTGLLDDGAEMPVTLITDRAGIAPAYGELVAEVVGHTVFMRFHHREPAGISPTALDHVTGFRANYVPLPAPLTTPQDPLTAPEITQDYLVAGLVHFMARRHDLEALAAVSQATMESVLQALLTNALTGWSVAG